MIRGKSGVWCMVERRFPSRLFVSAAMPKRQANSLGAAVLTASALANASQLCPIPAIQTLFRLAALALDICSVRAHLSLSCTGLLDFNEIPRVPKMQRMMCNTLRVTLAKLF